MAVKEKFSIHWFRRDLRVAGNQLLQSQIKKYDGRVLGVFCFDKSFLARPDFSKNRFQFFLHTLKELQKELQDLGGDLLVVDVGPQDFFKSLVKELPQLKNLELSAVCFNRDYEPFALKRDLEIKDFFNKNEIQLLTGRDHLLIEPWELEKPNREGYQVYTPFSKKWIEILRTKDIQDRIQIQKQAVDYLEDRLKNKTKKMFSLSWSDLGKSFKYKDALNDFIKENSIDVKIQIPPAGSLNAYLAAKEFKSKLNKYGDKRDFPIEQGTSKLSIYLKNGSLTLPQLMYMYDLKKGYDKKITGEDMYLSELIWREFYYHILYRNPRVESEAFLKKYIDIKWGNSKKFFKAWQDGLTGYPIVDAGMRELKTTGLMHNRVRMIVASFLIKDLLIDWKWGERYFMELLLDGDLAANNGGWQWAASTGCDPQPYFRIFNPWLQSQKFDPDGKYIKTYVPELKNIKASDLHKPILNHMTYPSPIVEHAEQKDKALQLYKSI